MIPLALQLSGLHAATDRRFRLSYLDKQMVQFNGRIGAMNDLLSSTFDQQKAINEAQQGAMDILRQSLDVFSDSLDHANDIAEEQRATEDERFAEWQTAIEALQAATEDAGQAVQEAFTRLGRSAGGKIGKKTEDGEMVFGEPWATGDIKWSHNDPSVTGLGTWAKCDGSAYDIAGNENLFEVIGLRYGGANAKFAVPRKSDLTSDATLVANNYVQAWIRT